MSNCLLFAVSKWLRFGGKVKARRSHYGWWPHFYWTLDGIACEEYIPPQPNSHLRFPPLLFRGIVRTFRKEI